MSRSWSRRQILGAVAVPAAALPIPPKVLKIENAEFRVEVDAGTGLLTSFFVKRNSCEIGKRSVNTVFRE